MNFNDEIFLSYCNNNIIKLLLSLYYKECIEITKNIYFSFKVISLNYRRQYRGQRSPAPALIMTSFIIYIWPVQNNELLALT